MSDNDKVKLMLSEIIYNRLDLKSIEDDLIENNVKGKTIQTVDGVEPISKYFFLMNDVNLDKLSPEENILLNNYLNDSVSASSKIELSNFLVQRMDKLLLPDTDQKYLYWGGDDFEHLAPADAFVLAFHYIRYDNFDEQKDYKREEFITEKLNHIQFNLAPSKGLRVAVIKFDEIVKGKQRII